MSKLYEQESDGDGDSDGDGLSVSVSEDVPRQRTDSLYSESSGGEDEDDKEEVEEGEEGEQAQTSIAEVQVVAEYAGSSKRQIFERRLLSKTCFKCNGRGHLDYMCTSTDISANDGAARCMLCQGKI